MEFGSAHITTLQLSLPRIACQHVNIPHVLICLRYSVRNRMNHDVEKDEELENVIRSIGLSVPHRKHIMSPLRAQQVNAICRFVTMVY
jgi:hypothetical protein